MCGILGGWTGELLAESEIRSSLERLHHRGPDDSGLYRDGSAFIAMRRLSIVDVAGGHQPIGNEDGSVQVVLNGEIYNYRDLSKDLVARGHVFQTNSDTEVLVHLYETYGTEMCSHLRGMFAFAIWDRRRQRLFLARDRFGKKPLFLWRSANNQILFASELKALRVLLEASGVPVEIEPQAVYDYLSLGCIPQPSTVYRGVECLEPGCCLEVTRRSTNATRYWQVPDTSPRSISYAAAVNTIRELVAESVRTRLRSDVPLGVFLSGGVDSSVVAYEAAKVIGPSLRTFTVAMADNEFDESHVAARTSRFLGVRNQPLVLNVIPENELIALVRHFDQPFADSSAIPTLAVSRLAGQYVTVALNGDGGDEVFGGYRRHMAARWRGIFSHLPSGLCNALSRSFRHLSDYRRSPLGFAGRFFRGVSLPFADRYLHWGFDLLKDDVKRELWKRQPQRQTEAWLDDSRPPASSDLKQQMLMDQRVILLSALLVKMDMSTMAASIEGRSPLLDHHLVEFTMSLPDSFLVRGRQSKRLLRDAYRPFLPSEVIDGSKRGFEIPLAKWLRHSLRPMLLDSLSSPNACLRHWIDGDFLDHILSHPAPRDFNSDSLLYSLLVLELWLQQHNELTVSSEIHGQLAA